MMFPITTTNRDDLAQLLERRGIETRPLLPLTNQPYLKALLGQDVEDRYPNAKRINAEGIYVGVHQHLTDEDMDYMISAFHEAFD